MLNAVCLPSGITDISSDAFEGCYNLAIYCGFSKDSTMGANEPWGASVKDGGSITVKYNCYCEDNIIYQSIETSDGYDFDGYKVIGLLDKNDPDIEILASCNEKPVTAINSAAFKNYSNLTTITIPSSVKTISHQAFMNCTGLTSIDIPDGVTYIGNYAFKGCTSLTYISIPKTVTEMHNGAFADCTSLDTIRCYFTRGSVVGEPWGAGNNTKILYDEILSENIYYTFNGATQSYEVMGVEDTSIVNVIIPASFRDLPVTTINAGAFSGCRKLTAVYIPKSVTTISTSAFSVPNITFYCGFSGGVAGVTYPSGNIMDGSAWGSWYPNSSPTVYYKCYCHENIIYADRSEGKDYLNCYVIDTFNTSALTRVEILDSCEGVPVTTIDRYAFKDCTNLLYLYIPDSIRSIKQSAFDGCTSLRTIYIPETVSEISDDALDNCTNLTGIHCGFSKDSAVSKSAPWGADSAAVSYDCERPAQ
jgi:hypothetical protein